MPESTVFATRSFWFTVPGRNPEFFADIDFVVRPFSGSCAYCGCRDRLQVVYCRASITHGDGLPVESKNSMAIRRRLFDALPHAAPFCERDIPAVLAAIEAGVGGLRIPGTLPLAA